MKIALLNQGGQFNIRSSPSKIRPVPDLARSRPIPSDLGPARPAASVPLYWRILAGGGEGRDFPAPARAERISRKVGVLR